MNKITIRDIAKEAGVSATAVSYVLNKKKGVNDKTRIRIQKVIDKHDYRPSLRSKSLSHGKNYCIHAVIRRQAAPACKAFYFNVIAQMVEQVDNRFSIVPIFQSDDTDKDKSLIEIILSHSTDGVIAFQGVVPEIEELLEKKNIPTVVVNPGIGVTEQTSVILDFDELAYKATNLLINHGHEKIGMIGMKCMPLFFDQSKSGFLRALKDADIDVNESWIRGEADCEANASLAMRKILETGTPTAVFCVQDNFAMSAMSLCIKEGLEVPKDVSFIAIDDVPEAQYLNPPLTTIPVSPAEIAEAALTLIFQKMKDGSPETIVLPSHKIVIRDSVRAIQPTHL
jgi:DNA-binding LacI/PurR family transcriptional regulator